MLFGAEILRLESEGAGETRINKHRADLAKIIDRMSAIEKKFQIGELDPSEVSKARNRLNALQIKENELLKYKGRSKVVGEQTGN